MHEVIVSEGNRAGQYFSNRCPRLIEGRAGCAAPENMHMRRLQIIASFNFTLGTWARIQRATIQSARNCCAQHVCTPNKHFLWLRCCYWAPCHIPFTMTPGTHQCNKLHGHQLKSCCRSRSLSSVPHPIHSRQE